MLKFEFCMCTLISTKRRRSYFSHKAYIQSHIPNSVANQDRRSATAQQMDQRSTRAIIRDRGLFVFTTQSNSKQSLSCTSVPPPSVLSRLIILLHLSGCLTRAYAGYRWISWSGYLQVNVRLRQLIGRNPSRITSNLWCSNGRAVPRSSEEKKEKK